MTDTKQRCSRCGGENEAGSKFCRECGRKFLPVGPAIEVGTEPGLYYCHKHKKETTRVTCGRCEKPICPRCIVMSPAGVRCRDCARHRRPVRLRGMLHSAGSSVQGIGYRQVWYLWLWTMIVRFFMGLFGR